MLLIALLLGGSQALQVPRLAISGRRRGLITAAAAAASASIGTLPVTAMNAEEMDALDMASRTATGKLLPSGVRVIDVQEGTGPLPTKGTRVYCHFKVWIKGFRSGEPADSSFRQVRPHDWVLGTPDDRIRAGFDEGALGMREGGWRRLVVPAELAYGEEGLRLPGKKFLIVPPNAEVFVDLRMVDGGSGKCDKILRPEGVTAKGAENLKSLTCIQGSV